MNPFARVAFTAAAIVVVAGGALYLLMPGNQGIGGPPAATPSPAPSEASSNAPSASAFEAVDPATWIPYTSVRYGYTLEHPAHWTIKPAEVDWEPGAIHSELSQWPDELSDPEGGYLGQGYTIYVGRQDLETGQTPESWTAQYITNKSLDAGDGCGDISTARYEPVEIDGETGQRIEMVCSSTAFYTAAIVVHDGSAYLVAIATPSNSRDARAVELFDAVLASFLFAAS